MVHYLVRSSPRLDTALSHINSRRPFHLFNTPRTFQIYNPIYAYIIYDVSFLQISSSKPSMHL